MKKALLILFLFVSAFSVTAQKSTSLTNTVYELSDKNISGSKNSIAIECNVRHILFDSDSTFYSINYCEGLETLVSGTYTMTKKEITLAFGNTIVRSFLDKEAGYKVYTDTITAAKTITLKAYTKKKQLNFENKKTLLALSGENYDNQLSAITEDNRLERLGMAIKSNIDIFEGTDFSSKYDSIIIRRGLDKFNGEMALNYFDDENKLSGSLNGGFYEGHVHYSPDGLFKIFVFTGEGCGAHCNSTFMSYVQFASGAVSGDVGFAAITTLEKYDSNTYIVIDSGWSGGTVGGNTLSLSLFSIENNSFTFHPLIYAAEAEPALQRFVDYQQTEFSIFSPWWADDFGKLEYDNSLHKVKYSYMDSGTDPESLAKYVPEEKLHFSSDEGLFVTGEFTIEDGQITNFKEAYKIEKVPSGK